MSKVQFHYRQACCTHYTKQQVITKVGAEVVFLSRVQTLYFHVEVEEGQLENNTAGTALNPSFLYFISNKVWDKALHT